MPEGNGGKEQQFVSEVDRLRAEVLHLRVIIAAHQEKDLINEIQQVRKDREEAQQKLIASKKEMSEKYDIDLSKQEIRADDGAIVNRTAADITNVIQKIAEAHQG